MLSMAMQANINASLKSTMTLTSQNLVFKPLTKTSILTKPKISSSRLSSFSGLQFNHHSPTTTTTTITKDKVSSSSPSVDQILADELSALDSSTDSPPLKQKLGVVVKPLEKPRLVLKFIWMQKDIGIALNQMIPGYGTIPLSPYYFWPRKDAWEELKVLLESKHWIPQTQRIHLLNQATDIINLWQASGGNLS